MEHALNHKNVAQNFAKNPSDFYKLGLDEELVTLFKRITTIQC